MIDLKATTGALTGLFFTVTGAGACWLTRPTAALGSGETSFPKAIGIGLIVVGIATAVRDIRGHFRLVPEWRIRAVLAVTGSVVVFAVAIEYGGLLPAVFASVLIAAFGSRDARLWPAIALALCVAVTMALVFVGLLGQPIKLMGGF